jgi:threonine dehydrogenase-like Zn-dependent dehydrogenase
VVRAADGTAKVLHGMNYGGPVGRPLMEGEWRNGSWGEVVRVPAENVHVLNEEALMESKDRGGLGYSLDDLGYINQLMISWGGLRDVDVRPGDTVLVAPATGSFGGSAVHVALSLGARVIAMGRNQEVLGDLKASAARSYPGSKFETAPISGSVEEVQAAIATAAKKLGCRGGMLDVYYDMTPPNAAASTHIKAGIMALRPGGRMSLMGGAAGDVPFPYYQIMVKGLRLQGTWMFTVEQARELIRLIETGRLKLGEEGAGVKCLGTFGLDQWEEAFRVAGDEARVGRYALFAPNGK